ncbi:DUF779 domain-containing protein [Azospirillum sp. sgz301742]
MVERVTVTPAAVALIERLKAVHGPLMFHQSAGCCDGSAPMCYPEGEFHLGDGDLRLGDIAGCPFYMGANHYEYWAHSQFIVDAVPGRGGSFSLEAPEGLRFLARSRLFTDAELEELAPLRPAPPCRDS